MATHLPDFLILGAAKCGTTSLYAYLRDHPDVFMPSEVKEPAFYAVPEAGGLTDEATYRALFSDARPGQLKGEASVAYLYDSGAPQRIREALGSNARLIILLRNPVDMAYSNWGHQVRAGVETLSFEDALTAESERATDPYFASRAGTWLGNMLYVDRATYAPQIQRYLDIFPREHIAIYVFEEFFADGLPQWDDLCAFLGIPSEPRPQPIVHNAAGTVRSPSLRRIYSERLWWKEPLKMILPAGLRARMMTWLQQVNRKDQPLPSLSPSTRTTLEHRMRADVQAVANILGRDDLSRLWF